jgi:hypothetical protein
MHTYNKTHVLLSSTDCYMFRLLLPHLQGELYRKLKIIVTLYFYTKDIITVRKMHGKEISSFTFYSLWNMALSRVLDCERNIIQQW